MINLLLDNNGCSAAVAQINRLQLNTGFWKHPHIYRNSCNELICYRWTFDRTQVIFHMTSRASHLANRSLSHSANQVNYSSTVSSALRTHLSRGEKIPVFRASRKSVLHAYDISHLPSNQSQRPILTHPCIRDPHTMQKSR